MESQTDLRVEAASQRRESLEQELSERNAAAIKEWEFKAEKAYEIKDQVNEEKRARAHASLEDVSAGHSRAELYNAIDKSEVMLEYEKHEFQQALAQDRKESHLDLIKEKQAHLQNAKAPSYETIIGDN